MPSPPAMPTASKPTRARDHRFRSTKLSCDAQLIRMQVKRKDSRQIRFIAVARLGSAAKKSGCSSAWLEHQTGGLGVGGSNPLTLTCWRIEQLNVDPASVACEV